jgi:hypothetical protein
MNVLVVEMEIFLKCKPGPGGSPALEGVSRAAAPGRLNHRGLHSQSMYAVVLVLGIYSMYMYVLFLKLYMYVLVTTCILAIAP